MAEGRWGPIARRRQSVEEQRSERRWRWGESGVTERESVVEEGASASV